MSNLLQKSIVIAVACILETIQLLEIRLFVQIIDAGKNCQEELNIYENCLILFSDSI
jgi:hypothetical protein